MYIAITDAPRGAITLGASAVNGIEEKGVDSLQQCIKKCTNAGRGIPLSVSWSSLDNACFVLGTCGSRYNIVDFWLRSLGPASHYYVTLSYQSRKHGICFWNFDFIMSTCCDTCTSGLTPAILDFPLPLIWKIIFKCGIDLFVTKENKTVPFVLISSLLYWL